MKTRINLCFVVCVFLLLSGLFSGCGKKHFKPLPPEYKSGGHTAFLFTVSPPSHQFIWEYDYKYETKQKVINTYSAERVGSLYKKNAFLELQKIRPILDSLGEPGRIPSMVFKEIADANNGNIAGIHFDPVQGSGYINGNSSFLRVGGQAKTENGRLGYEYPRVESEATDLQAVVEINYLGLIKTEAKSLLSR